MASGIEFMSTGLTWGWATVCKVAQVGLRPAIKGCPGLPACNIRVPVGFSVLAPWLEARQGSS